MATPSAPPSGLLATPQALAFAQAIDLLEQMAAPRQSPQRRRPREDYMPLGRGTNPQLEVVRLSATFGLAFNGSAIDGLDGPAPAGEADEAGRSDQRSLLRVNFFGLGGSDGPLPEAYLEMVMGPLLLRDHGVADFLDIFQHRLLSLLYRSENELRPAAPFQAPEGSAFMPALRAVLGLRGAAGARDAVLVAHAGLAAQQRHSMAGLLALVRSVAGAPVGGREFAGRWVDLPPALRTTLGRGGRNDLLGRGAVLGGRRWDQNGAVELSIGPLSLRDYKALLPRGARHAALEQLLAHYLGAHVAAVVHLTLAEAPAGDDGAHLLGAGDVRLGHTSWLRAHDAEPAGAADGADPKRATLVFNDGLPGAGAGS